ncbi:MAG: DUF6444 domain-containing protein [Deltaproteobacteria bacterium]|nr:DUF6444 domain-containing protein [Deltaproteobacteria bacterium]
MASSKLTIKEVTREIPKIIKILEQKIQIIKPHDDSLKLWKEAIHLLAVLFKMVIFLCQERAPKNSSNSSVSPSSDPNRKKHSNEGKSGKSKGGQEAHHGARLEHFENPDRIVPLKVNSPEITNEPGWHFLGIEIRQTVEVRVIRLVTVYQAEIWENENGKKIVADFPEAAKNSSYKQYVRTVKDSNETSNIQSKTNAASYEASQAVKSSEPDAPVLSTQEQASQAAESSESDAPVLTAQKQAGQAAELQSPMSLF